jgi:hypothetical protein
VIDHGLRDSGQRYFLPLRGDGVEQRFQILTIPAFQLR